MLVTGLAGCGSGPKLIEPSGSMATPADAWKKGFSSEQLDEYDKALARWNHWRADAHGIWGAGRLTPEAEALAQQYWVVPQMALHDLPLWEENHITKSGDITVFWTRATEVHLDGQRWEVRIHQCAESHLRVYQDGEEIPQGADTKGPVDSFILMWATADEPYKIVNIDAGGQPKTNGGKPCEP